MTLDLSNMTVTRAPVEAEAAPVDRTPVITEEIRAENLRRAKFPALVHVNADGTRSWRHDIVKHGDGMRDTGGKHDPNPTGFSTGGGDCGEGTRDSIKLLAKEGAVEVDGLLPREGKSDGPARDASGRFASKDER